MEGLTPPPRRPSAGGAIEKWAFRLFVPMLFLALFAAMFAIAGPRIDWRAWFDGPERGTWRAQEIDGLDVSGERMWVAVADGEIRGGRDGCNYWGYSGDPDPETGERMMDTTLALCSETPESRAYAAIAHWRSELALASEDTLIVSHAGVSGRFIRWTDEMEAAERAADEAEMARQRELQPPDPPRSAQPAIAEPPIIRPQPPEPSPPPPPQAITP